MLYIPALKRKKKYFQRSCLFTRTFLSCRISLPRHKCYQCVKCKSVFGEGLVRHLDSASILIQSLNIVPMGGMQLEYVLLHQSRVANPREAPCEAQREYIVIYTLWALWLGKPFHIAGPRLFSSILVGQAGEKGGRCKSVAIGLSLDLPCLEVFNFLIFLATLGLCCYMQTFSSCSRQGILSSFSSQASHCGVFSCCRAQPLEHVGFYSCSAQA